MATRKQILSVTDLRGGRNGADSPLALAENECVEALNIDYWQGMLGRRRGGAAALAIGLNVSNVVSGFRHVPDNDEGAAELWTLTADGVIKRRAAGATTTPGISDAVTGDRFRAASHNGKLFLAFQSAQDRLHVWDGTSIRRVGFATPTGAPTLVLAAGAVTDTRRYKSTVVQKSGSTYVRRSPLSAVTADTPLAVQQATATLVGAPGEGETHWELWAASLTENYANYYKVAEAAIGSTITDNLATATLLTGTLETSVGEDTAPTSWRYILSDGQHLIGVGSNGTGQRNRVMFTPALGSSDIGDDERVPTDHFYILGEKDGDTITGMAGPVNGSIYVFKTRSVWKLVPTGSPASPYRPILVTKSIGAVTQESIALGDDEDGNPAVYFTSHRGPCRASYRGVEYLGNNVEDVWPTVNLAASYPAHTVCYTEIHQVWFYIAVSGGAFPTKKLVYDTVLKAWCIHDGASAAAYCSFMFGDLTTPVGRKLYPHVGCAAGVAMKCDTTATNDAGSTFQAYVLTKPYYPVGYGRSCGVSDPHLVGEVTASPIRVTLIADLGSKSRFVDVSLTTTGAGESHRQVQVPGLSLASAWAVQLKIGDAAATSSAFTLDAVAIPLRGEEDR